jgi:hypothetical protein
MYGPETLLLASKKPRIRDLVERSRKMTEDEIRGLPEKPDVIRGLLMINNLSEGQKKATIAENLADMMTVDNVPTTGLEEMRCEIYRITSESFWVHIGASQLEVREGWNWAVLEDGRLWLSGNILDSKATLALLSSKSSFVQSGTIKADLYRLEIDRRNNL